MLKIYGNARSRAFRVLWLCRELDIPFENVDLTTQVDGSIPAIEDDGFVLWEPAAIILYLARRNAARLWPSTVHGEGRMLQWAFFTATQIEPPMNTLHEHRVRLPERERNAAIADNCQRRLLEKLGVLEVQLAATPYFGGVRWDLSDFIVASALYAIYEMKLDLVQVPKVDRWLTRSVQRPAAREAIMLRA